MLNRVSVTIDGIAYTIVADETEDYIRKNAELVDQKISELKASTTHSALACAVLAALNVADMYYKSQKSCENMRAQIREYADENAGLRAELGRLKQQRR